MKKLFWDNRLQRLPALWRILLQALMIVILGFPLISLATVAGMFNASRIAGTSFSEQFLALQSDPATATQLLENDPVTLLLNVVAQGLAVVIAIFVAARLLDKRKIADFGLHFSHRWWSDFGFGLALGALLMFLIFLIEYAAGWIKITDTFDSGFDDISFGPAMLGALGLFLAVGIYEELISRGYHLKNMAEGLGFIGSRAAIVIALLLSSTIFGLLHAMNPNATPLATFNIFLAGIFLGLGYVLTGELAIPIGLHITWNFFQGNVFGFPVSGNIAGPSLIRVEQGGDPLITGGAFGPEAGLIGIGAMIVGSVLIALWVRQNHGSADLQLALTEPDLTKKHQLVLTKVNTEMI